MYTNADGLINKRDELVLRIKNSRMPQIIIVTEVIPKGQKAALMPGDLSIEGYRGPFTNFELGVSHPGNGKRGVAIYVCEEVEHVEADKLDFKLTLVESVVVSLNGLSQKILIAGIYRSPSSPEPDATKELCEFLDAVSEEHYSEVVIVGDFNYPEIDWAESRSRAGLQHQASSFLSAVQENLFTQHITEGTHYRSGQMSNILDLVITGNKDSITNLDMEAPLGRSDHAVITFTLMCGKVKSRVAHAPYLKD